MNVSQSWKGSHWRKLHFSCWKCPALRVDTFLSPCKRFRPCFGIPNMLPLQGDNKKMEDAKFYLSLPGTKAEMEEKELQASKALANFTPTKDSTKDSFQIATLICSTKLTQNGRRDDLSDTSIGFSLWFPWISLLALGHWTLCGAVFWGAVLGSLDSALSSSWTPLSCPMMLIIRGGHWSWQRNVSLLPKQVWPRAGRVSH